MDAVPEPQVADRFSVWGGAITGTADDVVAGLRSYVDRGIEQLIIQFHDYGRPETLTLFADEVLGALT